MSQTIKFITYGDKKFTQSRQRLTREAKSSGFFTHQEAFTRTKIESFSQFHEAISNPASCPEWIRKIPTLGELFCTQFYGHGGKNAKSHAAGGGFWMWKPLVIYENLQKLNNGDLLFYADAGCRLPHTDPCVIAKKKVAINVKLERYADRVSSHPTGIMAFTNLHTEHHYTKVDVFHHFNCVNDKKITHTSQISGGRIVVRKCPASMKIIKLWWDTAKNHPYLFSNRRNPALAPLYPKGSPKGMVSHRHDQSNFSVIAKKFNIYQDRCYMEGAFKCSRIRK
jgi:hypothetical protein